MKKTDVLSLLHGCNDTTIENKLANDYGINISEIYNSFHPNNDTDIIDEIFAYCYYTVLNNEKKNGQLTLGFYIDDSYRNARSEFLRDPFLCPFKRHALIITGYTLQDYNSNDYMHVGLYDAEYEEHPFKQVYTSRNYQKKENYILPDRCLKYDPQQLKKSKQQVVSLYKSFPNHIFNIEQHQKHNKSTFYYRDFLPEFDHSVTKTHSDRNISRVFLNEKKITNAENKRINKIVYDTINSLLSYYSHTLNDCLQLDNKIEQFYYYYKLESIFGVDNLIHAINHIANNNLSIDDLRLFHMLPNVFDRAYHQTLYIDKELSKDDIVYMYNRLIPLITNTFYLLTQKTFGKESVNVISSYLNAHIYEPPQPKEYKLENMFFPQNEEYAYYQWFSTWSTAAFCLTENYTNDFSPQCGWIQNTIDQYVAQSSRTQKETMLDYLFTHYATQNWQIPSSRLL